MKIRALTLGLSVLQVDFCDHAISLKNKISQGATFLGLLGEKLSQYGYEVQTKRLTLNSFSDWVDRDDITKNVLILIDQLNENNLDFCSIGGVTEFSDLQYMSQLLSLSKKLYGCALFEKSENEPILPPDFNQCVTAAEVLRNTHNSINDRYGGFHFCAAFNCQSNGPFFPASYHRRDTPMKLTIGLENGDLLFIALHGVNNLKIAHNNIVTTLRQVFIPLENIISPICKEYNLDYGGIDASFVPGLALPVDSVVGNMEMLSHGNSVPNLFGDFGTLSTVSCITKAIHSLRDENTVKLCGYNGLMLPVMEDRVLAERASMSPPSFRMRDLLLFSSVCGVGLDTVPIPEDFTTDEVAKIFYETGAMAFRLGKPLSCRLIPMRGKKAGDLITTEELAPVNPYLCGTRVFDVK